MSTALPTAKVLNPVSVPRETFLTRTGALPRFLALFCAAHSPPACKPSKEGRKLCEYGPPSAVFVLAAPTALFAMKTLPNCTAGRTAQQRRQGLNYRALCRTEILLFLGSAALDKDRWLGYIHARTNSERMRDSPNSMNCECVNFAHDIGPYIDGLEELTAPH